jgi:tetratricopeptide (TPR) repeat protein
MAPAAHHSLDECIRINYNYMEAYMEKGFLYWDAGNIATAKKIFSTVIQLKGTYADGYYWLANCEARLKDTSAAVAHFQQAQRLDPGMALPGYATGGR